jgi:hypothetical protein
MSYARESLYFRLSFHLSFGFHLPSFGALHWSAGCACHCVKLKSMMAVGEHRTLLAAKWWRWERIGLGGDHHRPTRITADKSTAQCSVKVFQWPLIQWSAPPDYVLPPT